MKTTVTILGSGSSGGVPRIGNNWGLCDSNNPRNRRQRCSILIRQRDENNNKNNILVDTSPDLRQQLLQNDVGQVNAVLYTHPHADQVHGIDDLRVAAINAGSRVPVWADDATAEMLQKRFGYCFKTPENSDYPPILTLHKLVAGEAVEFEGVDGKQLSILPFLVDHGRIHSLGFRVGNVAYTPDINGVPDESMSALENLDVWVIDALKRVPHPTHFGLDDALEWIARVKPKRAILTNMHVDMDYETLRRELPTGVEPGYDGLTFDV